MKQKIPFAGSFHGSSQEQDISPKLVELPDAGRAGSGCNS